MNLAVPIIAGTAIRGVAATLMMNRVLERHPRAFLVTLAQFGVTIPLHRSQEHLEADIRRGLEERKFDPDTPLVIVGHSQGGLAALRYAADHPDRVRHAISIGAPWHGARSATNVARFVPRRFTPAVYDMAEGSRFLSELHADLPAVADRVTNIYSTHEILIRPYVAAHIDVPGVRNILVGSDEEHRRHLDMYPHHEVDDVVLGSVNHFSEMNSPKVRSRIWAQVEATERDLAADAGSSPTSGESSAPSQDLLPPPPRTSAEDGVGAQRRGSLRIVAPGAD